MKRFASLALLVVASHLLQPGWFPPAPGAEPVFDAHRFQRTFAAFH